MASHIERPRFTHLTLAEREVIRRLLGSWSLSEIAGALGESPSTISRELKRNTNAGNIYYEHHAQTRMLRRRRAAKASLRVIDNDLTLQAYVENLLKHGLSPEQIAGYMRRSGHDRPLTHKTIYNWIHRQWQSRKAFLRFRGRPRIPYGQQKRLWQPHKRHISQRPAVVFKRRRVGDWEADLVHGTQDDSRHCLLTLNDRASGFCIVRKLTSRHPIVVLKAMVSALDGLPVKTITVDNGFEFARHRILERQLHCQVYFTDTHSPQQRGSNENLNGLLREFFPKRKSLAHVTQDDALRAATLLNRRPRKRFGYECPRNVFAAMSGLSPYVTR